jgi:ABC-type bacteriocin/lantibiotic exporter with double-glycine peptidase domain
MAGLAKAAEVVGLKAEGVQVSREGLGQVVWPALAWANGNHYLVVWSVQGDAEQGTATIQDPNHVQEETIPREKLLQLCGGYLLLLHR